MQDMILFLIVMFVVVLMFALTFWTLYNVEVVNDDADTSVTFETIGGALRTTLFAGIFTDFDLDSMDVAYSKEFAQVLLFVMLTITSVISLNALITFIGNTFERVLGEKNAVLYHMKALMILEIYCNMSRTDREKVELENKWTYINVSKSTLELMGNNTNNTDNNDFSSNRHYQNHDTVTKQDLFKIKAELKAEMTIELNKAIDKIEALLTEKYNNTS